MKFTDETKRRAVRTFLQVFLSTIGGGIASIVVETDSRALRISILLLVASAIGTALGAVMNLERTGGEDNGENE